MDEFKARNDFDYWLSYQVTDVKLLSQEERRSFYHSWLDKVTNNFPM